MRPFSTSSFFILILTVIGIFPVAANEATIQIILASQMTDIADPEQGRYAELKQLIEDERREVPTTFFLFGGGSIGPSAFSNLDRGSHIIDLLNSLEPDAMGLAKRDFSYYVDELSLRSYEAAFPIVVSNLIDKRHNDVPDGLTDRALITRNNITLGFISISDQRLISEYLVTDLLVQDKALRIRQVSEELRKAGADLIILHYFDVFWGINELLDEGVVNYAFNSHSRASARVKEQMAEDKRIFVSDKQGQALVANFSTTSGFPIQSLEKVKLSELRADPAVDSQVNAYVFRLNRLLDDSVAYWDGFYSTRREEVRAKENPFANYVVDAMRKFSGADVAIINAGSIRGDTSYNKNTQITRRTIATELPFRSTLTVISVTGQQLIDVLEVGFAGLDLLQGAFPQVSGMRVEFNSSAPQGSRVLSLLINGSAVDPNKQYRLATTDYLASGGDGYTPLIASNKKAALVLGRTILISDLVLKTLRMSGKLDSKLEQRIIDNTSQP